MAADRLADMASELSSCKPLEPSISSTPQVDLLWRIASFLFRKRWETRVAAALALEKVSSVIDVAGLLHCLFGLRLPTGTDPLGDTAIDSGGARPVFPVGLALLRFETLDIARVLAEGELLVASTGQEYQLKKARSGMSREELERQKAEILKRLGLFDGNGDERTHRALARANEARSSKDALSRYGVEEEDLVGTPGSQEQGAGDPHGEGLPPGAPGKAVDVADKTTRSMRRAGMSSGGGGGSLGTGHETAGTKQSVERQRGALGQPAEAPEPSEVHALPWLAEHLSIRLFDRNWETRHGAVLGLTALFKVWRRRWRDAWTKAIAGWLDAWGEDVACRCLCLLALDRFGDYSVGSMVAPVREVAGQLLALVLLGDLDEGSGASPKLDGAHRRCEVDRHRAQFEAVLGRLKILTGDGEADGRSGDESTREAKRGGQPRIREGGERVPVAQPRAKRRRRSSETDQRTVSNDITTPCWARVSVASSAVSWETRHGGFVGLKYLVAVASDTVRIHACDLLHWACEGLDDEVDDVRVAAATAGVSLVQCLKRQGGCPAPQLPSENLELVLRPVVQALVGEAGSLDLCAGCRAEGPLAMPDECLAHMTENATSSYLVVFFRLASSALQLVKDTDVAPATWDVPRTSANPPLLCGWCRCPCHIALPTTSLPGRRPGNKNRVRASPLQIRPSHPFFALLLVGTRHSQPTVRAAAVDLLGTLLQYWSNVMDRAQGEPSKDSWSSESLRDVATALPDMTWWVLVTLSEGVRENGKGNQDVNFDKIAEIWRSITSMLGPSAAGDVLISSVNRYLDGDLSVPESSGSGENCRAITRTSKAIVLLGGKSPSGTRDKGLTLVVEAVRKPGTAFERAALLLGQWHEEMQTGKEKGEGRIVLWNAFNTNLLRLKASAPEPDPCESRRWMMAAAVALVQGGVRADLTEMQDIEKPGILFWALMEAIKEEKDKMRQTLAGGALVRLGLGALNCGRGQEGFEKAMKNLCLLACLKEHGRDLPARVGAREALKQLASKVDNPFVYFGGPSFWGRFQASIKPRPRWLVGEGCLRHWEKIDAYEDELGNLKDDEDKLEMCDQLRISPEDAIRVVMVVTPVAPEAFMAQLAFCLPALVRRATMDEVDDVHNTKLVNMLAARAASNIFKQVPLTDVALKAHEMALILDHSLRRRRSPREEDKRPRAAFCLFEVTKALTESPGPRHVKAALPFLLPVAMATIVDDNAEVRLYGLQSFNLLVGVVPLMEPKDWFVESKRDHSCKKEGFKTTSTFELRQSALLHLLLGGQVKLAHASEGSQGKKLLTLPDRLPSLFRKGLVLRPYQWDGIMWLTLLRRAGLHGALCDDMGLGKTLQTLVAMAVARCEAEDGGKEGEDQVEHCRPQILAHSLPSLVLCPATLSGHWYFEARRFLLPETVVTVQYAAGLSSLEKERALEGLDSRHLVVASYEMLRRDNAWKGSMQQAEEVREGGAREGRGLLMRQAWNYIIFDEVHVLRGGERTLLGKAVRNLRGQHRLGLTGTPLQNQVQDVWGVFDVLMPGLLGTKQVFERSYGRPIGKATMRSASADATAEALGKLDDLHTHLLPFLLRREKGKVLKDLPPKTVTDLACELTQLQREMYDGHCHTKRATEVLTGLQALVDRDDGAAKGREGVDRESLKEQLGAQALRLLQYLRLLCVHPALVLESGSRVRGQLLREIECSGKMLALQNLLFACNVVKDLEEGDGGSRDGGNEEQAIDGNVIGFCATEGMLENFEDGVSQGSGGMGPEGEDEHISQEGESEIEDIPRMHTNLRAQSPKAIESTSGFPSDFREDLHRCLIFAQHRVTLDAIETSILARAQWNPAYAELEDASSRPETGTGEDSGSTIGCETRSAASMNFTTGTRYLRLDGSVPSWRRESLVQRFNQDKSIPLMLLTTRVGGLGLNLTGADVVIFVEHDWNPAVDLQAMDRAHRIGQSRPVNVYRLVTRGTVEEQVMALQRRKQHLADAVVTEQNASSLTVGAGMSAVLDLVAGSITGDKSQESIDFFGVGTTNKDGSGGEMAKGLSSLSAGVLSEEPWGEEQYDSFAVERFLADVVANSSEIA